MEVKLKRVRAFILLAEDGVMTLLLTAMILLAVAQILLRNFFDSGIIWADPTLPWFFLLFGAVLIITYWPSLSLALLDRG
ncbi:hypothetical protein DJ030_11215 [bacterium endosymbiont of Escarpia laminata]|nr:MAG: hypothetical protein DJ030_11215 [bacterium endosymbiont of Escarpia laminata]